MKFFTAISTYNGERFKFNIYSTHADSIVPPFNLETGVKNKEYKVEKRRTIINKDGEPEYEKYFDVFYSEPSEDFNGLEVQLEVKKHNKQEVITAVQNQLLYFSNVTLDVHYHAGEIQSIPVQAEILYEDDFIVISDNNQFSKPHILINGISYGYVDFLELETEEKQGNIGIKVSPEEIEVVPSREEVIWNEVTGKTVKARFNQVVDIASKYVSDQLVEKDFLKWLRLCSASLSGSYDPGRLTDNRTKVMAVLAQIADITELRPVYIEDPNIKYSNQLWTLMPNVIVQYLHKEAVYKNGNNFHKVGRKAVSKLGQIGDLPIFFKESRTSVRKDMFLLTIYPGGFITVQDKDLVDMTKEDETPDLFDKLDTAPLRTNQMLELVKASAGVLVYEEVEVPEDFTIKDKPVTEDESEDDEETLMSDDGKVFVSAKDRRKLEGKIVVHTLRSRNTTNNRQFDWHKMEVGVTELEKLDDLELYYSCQDFEELLNVAASLTAPCAKVEYDEQPGCDTTQNMWASGNCNSWFKGSNVRLIKVSKQNERYMGDNHAHITSFFSKFRNGILTMSNLLIQWNTARLIHKHIDELGFMTSFNVIDPIIASRYAKMYDYYSKHHRSLENIGAGGEIIEHLDRITELQLYAHQNPDDAEGISVMAKTLFNQDPNAANIKGAVGYDLEVYAELFDLLEYAKPLKTMLNMVQKLTYDGADPLTLEEEQTIKSYVAERVS